MAFDDLFRVGAHGVFLNGEGKILQLKSSYGEKQFGLPGGALDPGETMHEALIRECREELGIDIQILYMSGIYFHQIYAAHVGVFRFDIPKLAPIQLSNEHTEYRYFTLDELNPIQRQRVSDCLAFDGRVKSAKF